MCSGCNPLLLAAVRSADGCVIVEFESGGEADRSIPAQKKSSNRGQKKNEACMTVLENLEGRSTAYLIHPLREAGGWVSHHDPRRHACCMRLQRRVDSILKRRRRIRSSRQILTITMRWSRTERPFKDLDVSMKPAMKVKDVETGVAA